jgi:hypothetical protein
MRQSRFFGGFGLAAVLFATSAGAQSAALPASPAQQEQAPFVLVLEGLTSTHQAALQAELAKLPTVAKVTVDLAAGKVSLATAAGIQLDADGAKIAATKAGVTVKNVELPAWSTETVWVVQAKAGS